MSLGKGFSPLLAYLAADSISILILISTDRTCLECMRAAEQHADIRMRSGLVFTGEVKIDIRLLVSLESEECLERYILTVRYEFLTAFRTVLRRKIISGTVFTGIIRN